MTNRKNKLQRLLKILTPDNTQVDFSEFDQSVEVLKKSLKEKIQVQTLDDVNRQLNKFPQKFDLSKVEAIAEGIKTQIENKIDELTDAVEQEKQALMIATQSGLDAQGRSVEQIRRDLDLLSIDLKTLASSKAIDLVNSEIIQLKDLGNSYLTQLTILAQKMSDAENGLRSEIVGVTSSIISLKSDLANRINNIPRGGGNANRNISVGGNASTLSRYGDINLKAGSNVTITYANNDATKNLDITFASSGGGSSVAGTVRSINRVSTSQTMGSVAGTDYVYIADQGIKLTLPNATGITNLYTVKNVAASSVLISTTAVQTIDTDSELILATQYTAVDLINDGANNWSIT